MSFEIIYKPTFTNQLLAMPKEFVMQILEKIEFLRDDSHTDGKHSRLTKLWQNKKIYQQIMSGSQP